MTIIEKHGSLFNCPQGYYLAHCISADFTLGAGIAKEFDSVYNMRYKLFRDYPHETDDLEEYIGCALLVDNVFNLVTEPKYYNKPSYDTVRAALVDMKFECTRMSIDKIAMPRIASGLDRLEWNRVREIIEDVFSDTDIEIVIYSL